MDSRLWAQASWRSYYLWTWRWKPRQLETDLRAGEKQGGMTLVPEASHARSLIMPRVLIYVCQLIQIWIMVSVTCNTRLWQPQCSRETGSCPTAVLSLFNVNSHPGSSVSILPRTEPPRANLFLIIYLFLDPRTAFFLTSKIPWLEMSAGWFRQLSA